MHIDAVLLYASAYLGGPFGTILAGMIRFIQPSYAEGGLLAAQIMGILGLVISAGLGIFVISRGRDQTCRAEAILLMIMAMVVGTALVTALGRLTFSYAQALSSRYATPALVFWSAAGVLSYLIATRSPSGIGRALSAVGVAVLAGLSAVIALHQIYAVRGFSETRLSRDEASIAMILGVKDDEALKHIFPDPSLPWGARDFLRQNRFSMFSEPHAQWYGKNIRDQFDVARKSRCRGVFDTATSVMSSNSGVDAVQGRVTGWIWDEELASVPSTIVIADEKGVVVGLGLTGYRRPDVAKAIPEIRSAHSGWQGLVYGVVGSSLTAYGVLDGRQMICRLEQDHPAPIPQISIDKTKGTVAMPVDRVRIDGMWQLDGDDQVNAPRPSLDGAVYGSWVGNDANTGRLTLAALPVPPSRRIVIPFVTGPSASNVSIVIRDSAGRELMKSQLASPMKWSALAVELPLSAGATIDLSADDDGKGWGQWMAIGAPRSIPVH